MFEFILLGALLASYFWGLVYLWYDMPPSSKLWTIGYLVYPLVFLVGPFVRYADKRRHYNYLPLKRGSWKEGGHEAGWFHKPKLCKRHNIKFPDQVENLKQLEIPNG